LLLRLRDWDDRESWSDFITAYSNLIFSTARKAGLTESESEDAVQETFISVCKNIAEFKYDAKAGGFKSWLLKLTRWRIQDQFRKRFPPVVNEDSGLKGGGTVLAAQPNMTAFVADTVWDLEWKKTLFAAASERVKRKVDAKLYQVFDLYILQEWPIEKIRKTLKVSSAKVYMAKYRISSLLKKEMRYMENETLWQELSSKTAAPPGITRPQ